MLISIFLCKSPRFLLFANNLTILSEAVTQLPTAPSFPRRQSIPVLTWLSKLNFCDRTGTGGNHQRYGRWLCDTYSNLKLEDYVSMPLKDMGSPIWQKQNKFMLPQKANWQVVIGQKPKSIYQRNVQILKR